MCAIAWAAFLQHTDMTLDWLFLYHPYSFLYLLTNLKANLDLLANSWQRQHKTLRKRVKGCTGADALASDWVFAAPFTVRDRARM